MRHTGASCFQCDESRLTATRLGLGLSGADKVHLNCYWGPTQLSRNATRRSIFHPRTTTVGTVVKFNSRCNLLKHHRYLRPIMQPSDSTRKKGCEKFVSAHIRKTQQ